MRPPAPGRIEIIRAALDSDVDQALVTLLAYVGLRPHEALAAVWSDITGGKLVVDASETGRTRVVLLLSIVRKELAELQLHQGRPGPAAPIIATDAGERWRDSRFRSFRRDRWSKIAPGMRPYGLRHAYVSLMIQAWHTVVEVAKWAGRSPVCLGTYAHLFDTVTERIDPDLAIREALRYPPGREASGWMTAVCTGVCTGSGWYADRPRRRPQECACLQAVCDERRRSSAGRALHS